MNTTGMNRINIQQALYTYNYYYHYYYYYLLLLFLESYLLKKQGNIGDTEAGLHLGL